MGTRIQQALGLGTPFVQVFPPPIIAQRAPVDGVDVNYPLGQEWINNSVSPAVLYVFLDGASGTWSLGGNAAATTTSQGVVELGTLSELQNGNAPAGPIVPLSNDVATVIQGIVVGAVPPATEGQAGIAKIATQAQTNTGTDDTTIVTPLKLATYISGGSAGAGSFTDLTATGTVSFTGATGGITMTSATASSFGTTGAGIDLTLSSASGRVVVNGEEAAADALRLVSAAGGLDVDVALQMNLVSSQNAADAIVINASAGGVDITAAGAAGEDIDITNTSGSIRLTAGESATDSINIESLIGGINILASGAAAGEDINITATGSSVNVSSTEDAALAIYLHANGGTSETIRLRADQGTGAASVELLSDGGGITLTGGAASANAINFTTTNAAGGVTLSLGTGGFLPTTTGPFTVVSTRNAAQAIELHANGGTSETIRLRADQGTGATSLDLLSDVGGITLSAGLGTSDAINITTSNASGGIDVDAGTSGFIVDTTGAVSLDSAAASNFTVTGAFDLTLNSTAGSVVVTGDEGAVDAIQLNATTAGGGIDINGGTGGITVDSGGLLSLDAAGVVNLTTTGAFDITVNSTAGSVILTGAEAAVDAIQLNATTVGGGVDINAGSGGITLDTTAGLSLDSATASNFTVTGAADLTLSSTAGSVIISASESAVDALQLLSTAGGIDILASGAAAGEDIDIVATGSSVNITSTENVTDAIVINASGAASAIQLDAGTGSFRIGTGLVVPVTAVDSAASPYTVLGTDYFISVDTSGGAVTVTLPAATALSGRTFVIRDTGGAAAVNNITIGGGGTNLVGGGAAAATKVLSAAYSGATVYSNGATWNYAYTA